MKVYTVMCEHWNGEYNVTETYAAYLKEADASAFVDTAMALPEGKKRSPYSSTYWVETIDVIG